MRTTLTAAILAIAALVSTARADTFVVNEPVASQREITVFLVDNSGNGVSGIAGGVTLQIAKSGANWTTPGATIAEVTGGPAGSYRISFTATDVNTTGDLMYAITDSGVIRPYVDRIRVTPPPGALDYNVAQGGASGSITLSTAASSTNNYYAGTGAGCVVQLIAGTGAGQARLGTGYTGSTRQLATSPNWVTNPDSTTVYRIIPITGQLDASVVASIQSGLATSSAVAAIPTNPELASDTRLNHLDADISSRASSSAVAAIPTNPLLTNDTRLNDLDAAVSSRASQTSVNSIPTNPLLTNDSRLNNLDAAVSTRASQTSLNSVSTNVSAIPTNPLLTNDSRLNDLDAAVSSRATQTSVNAIPTNPELASDSKLSNLDAAVSTRATQSSVNAIPTNPELASDSKLSNLDAAVSSRLAPATPGRTLAVTSTGEVGLNWADIVGGTTTQNLGNTTVNGGGGGGNPSTIAAAVWAYVPDSAVTNTAMQTMQQQWNILFSVDAGNAVGLDGTVGSTESLDLTKHRAEFTVQSGVRTFTLYNGN